MRRVAARGGRRQRRSATGGTRRASQRARSCVSCVPLGQACDRVVGGAEHGDEERVGDGCGGSKGFARSQRRGTGGASLRARCGALWEQRAAWRDRHSRGSGDRDGAVRAACSRSRRAAPSPSPSKSSHCAHARR
ncbi:hypothetical protein FA09DRAFT_14775 [Tilletiopsis washingtonensis]|uniref:Uncharacterized protein n=1 Tax=Tilletiopsis washingtonensis TaxID=58919 RepID=A0A316ZI16_9BASI|nr:hypothetical protein FA09DRAFT_14775 [Tilletiopsis washingtonensis]PWO01418.1 hypothetical protein FA09DRAFT_14775 [Tilletiopsis washingtonensis]